MCVRELEPGSHGEVFRKQNLVLLRLSPAVHDGDGGGANVPRLWTRLEEQNPVSRNPCVPQEERSAVKQG